MLMGCREAGLTFLCDVWITESDHPLRRQEYFHDQKQLSSRSAAIARLGFLAWSWVGTCTSLTAARPWNISGTISIARLDEHTILLLKEDFSLTKSPLSPHFTHYGVPWHKQLQLKQWLASNFPDYLASFPSVKFKKKKSWGGWGILIFCIATSLLLGMASLHIASHVHNSGVEGGKGADSLHYCCHAFLIDVDAIWPPVTTHEPAIRCNATY